MYVRILNIHFNFTEMPYIQPIFTHIYIHAYTYVCTHREQSLSCCHRLWLVKYVENLPNVWGWPTLAAKCGDLPRAIQAAGQLQRLGYAARPLAALLPRWNPALQSSKFEVQSCKREEAGGLSNERNAKESVGQHWRGLYQPLLGARREDGPSLFLALGGRLLAIFGNTLTHVWTNKQRSFLWQMS